MKTPTSQEEQAKIMGNVALPCGLIELSEIADVFIAQTKRDNRQCLMRQNGDFMEFVSVPPKKINQP